MNARAPTIPAHNEHVTSAHVTSAPYSPVAGVRTPEWVDARNRLIATGSMLGRLPERDLLALLQRSTVRTLQSRKEIFSCGDAGRTVIAVLEGLVKLSTTSVGGREVVLDIVVPGACFGELAVLNNWARDTDAVTISRCRLLVIDGRQFNQVMERSAEGSQAMIRLLSERLRAARQRVVDAVVLPAPARLAKELIDLAEAQYTVVRDGARIKLPLSQAELGGMTGLTRESINKNLAALRDAGWIALGGGAVTLLDVEALRDLPREHDGRSGRATANGRGARSVFAGPPFSVCDPAIQPRP